MTRRRNTRQASVLKDMQKNLMPLQRTLLEEADRQITILAEGREQKTTIGNVVVRKLLQTAASGSPQALGHSVSAIIAAQQLKQHEIDENVRFARRYKEHQQELLDQAIKSGGDPETVLPHPDDILVIEGEGYRIVGPADAAELKIMKDNCARRDVYILQAVLEERVVSKVPSEASGPFPGATPMLLIHFMNEGLPARYYRSDHDIVMMMGRYHRLTKRELLKEARKAWASLGRRHPRGWTMPPFDETRERMERLIPPCVDVVSQVMAGKLPNEHEIAVRLKAMARQ